MNDSLKLAALFIWVLGAIYIKEDAKQQIKDHAVVSYDYNVGSPRHASSDSVVILSEVR